MPWTMAPFDPESVGPQPVNRTALQRSRFFDWAPGTSEGEHCHLGAEQALLVVDGQLALTTPRGRRVLTAGQLACCPPECRHAVRAVGEKRCRFWVVVAPNREPTHTFRDFPAGSEAIDAAVNDLAAPAVISISRHMRAEVLTLSPGQSTSRQTLHEQERLVYVLTGSAFATVKHLSGALPPHTILHVPREFPHQLRNTSAETPLAALVLTLPAV